MLFDYTDVSAGDVARVTDDAIAAVGQLVDAIVTDGAHPTFATTLRLIEDATATLSDAYGRGAFLANVSVDPEVRAEARAAEERLSKWQVDLAFRRDLYEAIAAFASTAEARALDGERARLLEFTVRDFRRAGHELSEATREEVKGHSLRLVELGVAFARNLAEYEDHLDVPLEALSELPEDYVARLEDVDGTARRVTMAYPDVVPFMENMPDRELRRRLAFKFANRAADANRPLLEEAVALRETVASLFGEPSWAHYRLEEKMAKTPERVEEFYDGIVPGLTRKGHAELAVIGELLERDTADSVVQGWDRGYYHNQQRRTDYGVDSSLVSEYFPLQQVLDGLLEITAEVFGLAYVPLAAETAWHEDVLLYRIEDAASGEHIAHFYADLFPREGKYTHAAAFPLVAARRSADGGRIAPISAIVANFTKPTGQSPSLLRHNEVTTLFHEFGHILHMSLSQAEFTRFSQANTEWDFVEAPSQIMEHWCWRAEVLSRFARHHETGEPIPPTLVDRMVAARDLNIGLDKLRQVSFGKLDMMLHGPEPEKDLDDIHRRAHAFTLLPLQEGTFFPANFGHLLGGYDAGYYGYLWAEVYGDDMFSRFEAEGLTSPVVGQAYRKAILEPNGARDADDLLQAFLGRPPSTAAFLRKLGI